jgi:hypothetical protein
MTNGIKRSRRFYNFGTDQVWPELKFPSWLADPESNKRITAAIGPLVSCKWERNVSSRSMSAA